MKWKDILIGALVSLFVTVAGGLAIYHFTKEPVLTKNEHLVYSVTKGGVFKGGSMNLALNSVKIENDGGVAAKNVSVTLSFDKAKITDISLDSDAGSKESFRKVSDNKVELTFDRLLPSESFVINLLLSKNESPIVSVRSDDSLASEKIFSQSKKSKINEIIGIGSVFASALLFVILIFTIKFLRGSGLELSRSQNNAGFLLLHNGLVDEAFKILNSAIISGQYDAFVLSNFALCKALKNDIVSAKKLINAANFRDRFGHGKAVILFNEALILLAEEKKNEALVKLKESIERSPKTIRLYCDRTIHLDSVKNEPEFRQAIKMA